MLAEFIADPVRLNQLLWNVLLFSNKNGAVKGDVYFTICDNVLYAVSCDDFIIMEDKIALIEGSHDGDSPNREFTISNADLKLIEKYSRDYKETITIILGEGTIKVGATEYSIGSPDLELWPILVELVGQDTPSTVPPADFYINPDRLKQIPRMKIDGDHPVAMRYIAADDQVMLAFLHGTSVRGILTSMSVEVLRDRGVHMWDDPEWVQPYIERVGVAVALSESKLPIAQQPEEWNDSVVAKHNGKPKNLTARVEYDTPLSTEAPAHVNAEEHVEYGF